MLAYFRRRADHPEADDGGVAKVAPIRSKWSWPQGFTASDAIICKTFHGLEKLVTLRLMAARQTSRVITPNREYVTWSISWAANTVRNYLQWVKLRMNWQPHLANIWEHGEAWATAISTQVDASSWKHRQDISVSIRFGVPVALGSMLDSLESFPFPEVLALAANGGQALEASA